MTLRATTLFEYFKKKPKRAPELGLDRHISANELREILSQFGPKERHYRLVFIILAFVGLRPNEVLNLQLHQFSRDFRELTLQLSKTKKAKRRQVVDFVAKEIEEFVKDHISQIIKFHGFLFYSDNPRCTTGRIQPCTLRWKMFRVRQKLGLDDYYLNPDSGKRHYRINVYSLRRFFITQVANNTKIHWAQDIIGHQKTDTTKIFVKRIGIPKEREILDKVFKDFLEKKTSDPNQKKLTDWMK